MITKFKLFENDLNNILDKLATNGKASLTKNEIDFMSNYPDVELEKVLHEFQQGNFKFILKNIETHISEMEMELSGVLIYNDIDYDGSFSVNIETEMIQPEFNINGDQNIYDVVGEYINELDDFFQYIYQSLDTIKK